MISNRRLHNLYLRSHWRELFFFLLLISYFDGRFLWSWSHQDPVLRFGDFLGIWSYGRLAVHGDLNTLYDVAALNAYQHRLYSMPPGELPFFYPPSMLFLMAPLGLMSAPAAWVVWTTSGLAAVLFAASPDRQRLGRPILLLLLPATVTSVAFGQTGLIAGALLLGGLRLVPTRPVLAGVLLGLLTIKPQMGIFVPLALVASGRWQSFLVAVATALGLAITTGLTFGFGAWVAWVHVLPIADLQWHTDAGTLLRFSPTLTASLAAMHLSWTVIRLAQLGSTALMACLVWRVCCRGLDRAAIAMVCAASLLVTPHGFIYDMPALCAALLLFVDRGRPTVPQQLAALCGQLIPIAAPALHLPVLMPAVLALLAVTLSGQSLRLAGRTTRSGQPGSGPFRATAKGVTELASCSCD